MLRIIQNKEAVQHKMKAEGAIPEVLDEDPGTRLCVDLCLLYNMRV